MARLLARTLSLARPTASPSTVRPLSDKLELIEIDLSEDSPSSSSGVAGDSTVDPMGMRRLEDAIHGVLVRWAAPEWLPFVPGGSYWVPPTRRLLWVSTPQRGAAGAAVRTEEEAMCFTTSRGWPSASYFVEGKLPHPVKKSRTDAAQTDDEDS